MLHHPQHSYFLCTLFRGLLCSDDCQCISFFFFFHTGTFAVLSIMVGIVCLQLAPESDYSYFNSTLNATVVDEQKMNEARLAISGTLACLTAIIQVIDQKCR